MITIEHAGKVYEFDTKEGGLKVTITGEVSKEVMHLTGDTKSYILRVTKEKKLILN